MANRFVLGTMHRAGFGGIVLAAEEQQLCPTAVFRQPGFAAAAAEKLRFLSGLPANGQPMLFCDADVVLFPGLAEWCENVLAGRPENWIGLQDDIVQWCTGVMLFRCTRPVLEWFRFVYDFCVLAELNDQDGWHSLRLAAKRMPVECEILPSDVIANYASVSGGDGVWTGQRFAMPPACRLWHANWCVGVERKYELLEYVMNAETSEVVAASG